MRLLQSEPVDIDVELVDRYEIAKVKFTMQINVPKMNKKRKDMIGSLERALREGVEQGQLLQITEGKT